MRRQVTASEAERFWTKVIKGDGCWLWSGHHEKNGYAVMWVWGNTYGAHQVSYALHNGGIAAGVVIRHKCDNPGCVRPDHLEAGTHADNVRDRVQRKRSARGERNGRAKLSISDLVDIRQQVGVVSQVSLARKYGVDRKVIYDIWHNNTWLGQSHGAATAQE